MTEYAAPVAYGYCRISLDREDSVSIEAQEDAIRRYHAHRLPHMGLVILQDRGVSGAIELLKRPQGSRLAQLRAGDQLIVTKVDRAFRSMADGAVMLDRFNQRQIGVHCLDVNIDTTSPTGRAMLHMLMVFAQLERERIGERRREAALYRRQQGECMHIARNPPMGWRVVGQGQSRRYVIDKADRKRCDELRKLHDSGMGVRKIEQWAQEHGKRSRSGTIWTRTTIRRALRASRAGYPTSSERFQEWDVTVPKAVQKKLKQSQRKRRRCGKAEK